MGSDPTGLFQQGILGHSQREDRVRTQGEGGHLQAKERDCKKPALLSYLDLALPAPRGMRKTISFV